MDANTEFEPNGPLGQVWTPDDIAIQMIEMLFEHANGNIPFLLDPSCGPATFEKGLLTTKRKPDRLLGLDVEDKFVSFTKDIISSNGISGNIIKKDYLLQNDFADEFDAVIMNPPYIRHENIDNEKKDEYHRYLNCHLDIKIDRRSNLFALFLLKSIIDLKSGGLLCAIVYDAVSQSAYGKQTLKILDEYCELIENKSVKAPFDGAIIDGNIILYRKKHKRSIAKDSLSNYSTPDGFVSIDNLIKIKRGTGLKLRKAFLVNNDEPLFDHAIPFFIKQQSLKGLVVSENHANNAFVFKNLSDIPKDVKSMIEQRLVDADKVPDKITHNPISAPILFNYYIRGNPRHLYNPRRITASDNFYCIEPKLDFPEEVAWLLLNSKYYLSEIVSTGRSQGNGLKKVQLFEYKSAIVPDWTLIPEKSLIEIRKSAESLIENDLSIEEVKSVSNTYVEKYLI